MFKRFYWAQPLYKNDVINVCLNGILSAIIGGVLAGVLDYLFMDVISLPLSFGLIIICYMIGNRMNKGYYSYHILYPTLSILFMVIALIFKEFSYLFMIIKDFSVFKYLISPKFYLNVITGPIYYIIQCFKSFNLLYLLLGIINLFIYVLAFRFCYKLVKGRN